MNGLAMYALVVGTTIAVLVGGVAVIMWLADEFAWSEDNLWPMDEDWTEAAGREQRDIIIWR